MNNYFEADNTTDLAIANLKNIIKNGKTVKRQVGDWCMKKDGEQDIFETSMNVFKLNDPTRCITSQHCLAVEIETEDYLLGLNPGYVHYSKWSFYKNWLINGKYRYTYGERGGRFLPELVKKLAISPSTRHGAINLWDKSIDLFHSFVPCTLQWIFDVKDKKLNMTTIMRSQDACRGFFLDTFAYPFIQQFVANQLDIGLGEYYHVILNSHIYSDDIDFANRLIKRLVELKPLVFEDNLTPNYFGYMENVSEYIFKKHKFHAAGVESRKLPEFWRQWKANQIIYQYTKIVKQDPTPVELTCAGVVMNEYP